MAYDIDEDITVGDTGHVEHHEALATAVNDLDTRALKIYASKAELDAVRTAEVGVLNVSDTLGTFPELINLTGNDASNITITTSVIDHWLDDDQSPGASIYRYLVQTTVMLDVGLSGSPVRFLARYALYDSAADTMLQPYGDWIIYQMLPPNTTGQEAIPASRADASFGWDYVLYEAAEGEIVPNALVHRQSDGTLLTKEDGENQVVASKEFVGGVIASTIPTRPPSGTYTFKSVDGTPTWVAD